ncbi:Hypothetical predicted protein [Mytilus galloprovincialis]|uniref:Uncharacterized protein n=1 Tax=Mytilus galloprovincialis TaxID=29158 RepID=A0A8B6C0E3_MYTGA|nr:Hypothetical predicted protein [Mytilus galloprovincialis]
MGPPIVSFSPARHGRPTSRPCSSRSAEATSQDISIASNDASLDILLSTTTQDIQISSNDDSLDILLSTTTEDSPIASNDDSLDI